MILNKIIVQKEDIAKVRRKIDDKHDEIEIATDIISILNYILLACT